MGVCFIDGDLNLTATVVEQPHAWVTFEAMKHNTSLIVSSALHTYTVFCNTENFTVYKWNLSLYNACSCYL